MTAVSESIDVTAPVDKVFPLFTSYETLPRFLEFIKDVQEIGPDLTHWVVAFAGQQREFDAKVVAVETLRRIRWESATPGMPFTIEAVTEAIDDANSRITINAEFDAGGLAEKLGLAKPIASKALAGELKNAKRYVERRFA